MGAPNFHTRIMLVVFALVLLSGVTAFDGHPVSGFGFLSSPKKLQAEARGQDDIGAYDYGYPPPYGEESSSTDISSASTSATSSKTSISKTSVTVSLSETSSLENPGYPTKSSEASSSYTTSTDASGTDGQSTSTGTKEVTLSSSIGKSSSVALSSTRQSKTSQYPVTSTGIQASRSESSRSPSLVSSVSSVIEDTTVLSSSSQSLLSTTASERVAASTLWVTVTKVNTLPRESSSVTESSDYQPPTSSGTKSTLSPESGVSVTLTSSVSKTISPSSLSISIVKSSSASTSETWTFITTTSSYAWLSSTDASSLANAASTTSRKSETSSSTVFHASSVSSSSTRESKSFVSARVSSSSKTRSSTSTSIVTTQVSTTPGPAVSTIYFTKVLTVSAIPQKNSSTSSSHGKSPTSTRRRPTVTTFPLPFSSTSISGSRSGSAAYTNSTSEAWGLSTILGTAITASHSSSSDKSVALNSSSTTRRVSSSSQYTSSFNISDTSSSAHSISATVITKTFTSIIPPYPTGRNASNSWLGSGVSRTGSAVQSTKTSIYEVTTTILLTASGWTSQTQFVPPTEHSTISSGSVLPLPITLNSTALQRSTVESLSASRTNGTAYPTPSKSVITLTFTKSVVSTVGGNQSTGWSRSSVYSSSPRWTNTTSQSSVPVTAPPQPTTVISLTAAPSDVAFNSTVVPVNGTTVATPQVSKITLTRVITLFPSTSQSASVTQNTSTLAGQNATSTSWYAAAQSQTVSHHNASITPSCAPYPYANITGFSTSCTALLEGSATRTRCLAIPTGSGHPWPLPNQNHTGNFTFSICSTSTATPVNTVTTLWSNSTVDASSRGTKSYPLPTTFKTAVTKVQSGVGSQNSSYPPPTGSKPVGTKLPDNPNFPWGGDSPLHRHQNVTGLGHGVKIGRFLKRGEWLAGWSKFVEKVKGLWQQGEQPPAVEKMEWV